MFTEPSCLRWHGVGVLPDVEEKDTSAMKKAAWTVGRAWVAVLCVSAAGAAELEVAGTLAVDLLYNPKTGYAPRKSGPARVEWQGNHERGPHGRGRSWREEGRGDQGSDCRLRGPRPSRRPRPLPSRGRSERPCPEP